MSLLGDEYRLIGSAYFHTGNSGLTMTILDKGFGITMRWEVSSHSMTAIGLEIDLEKDACRELMWLAIGAAVNEQTYPDNIMNAPDPKMEFGDRTADLLYDSVDLISPTGKVTIGYRCEPQLELYIEGKSHGVPNFAGRIETTRMAFVDMAKLFYKAKDAEYSPAMRNAYAVKTSSRLAKILSLDFVGSKKRLAEALAKFKKLLHVEKALGG